MTGTHDTTNLAANQMQSPSLWSIAGQLDIDTVNGGSLTIDGVAVDASAAELDKLDGCTASTADLNANSGQPHTATIAPAAGSTNICLVTITVKDADGVAITGPCIIDVYLSDAATGAGLTAVTASGTVVAGASGVDLQTGTAKKHLRVQTTAAGVYILAITDSAKTGFYVCVQIPGRKVVVGSVLVTGNYG